MVFGERIGKLALCVLAEVLQGSSLREHSLPFNLWALGLRASSDLAAGEGIVIFHRGS